MPTEETKASIENYLAGLPDDRREALTAVRKTIVENLPDGYEETFTGMITYVVPLETYPKTYNNAPLMLASLASQKNHMAVYMMSVYADPDLEQWFVDAYKATGKKLDMGSSCVRFKKLDDLPVELIGEAISKVSVDAFIQRHEEVRAEAAAKKKANKK